MPAVPSPLSVARWAGELAGEVARLPSTLGRARRLLVTLPERLDDLIAALERTTAAVEAVEGRTAKLDESLDEVTAAVAELGKTVTGALGAIPGVRRAVRQQR